MKNKILVLVVVLFFAVSILSACVDMGQGQEEEEVIYEPVPTGIYNPLTGLYVETTQNLTAVMFDNMMPARPQSGLIYADIVYEIEAEGTITRFMALFHGDPPEFVGPVRSARPYYMQIAREWDAYFVHVGGCDVSRTRAREWNIRNIDDMRGDRGFFVDRERRRPHNTYFNFANALEGKAENGNFGNWVFIDAPEKEPTYTQISFRYINTNRVTYIWDSSRQVYMRYINDSPHVDRGSGEQLFANNIIFQHAVHRNLGTALDHISVDVVGSGEAIFFLGGQYQRGTWSKASLTEPTVFLDQYGQPINFVRGNTWIQVVRTGTNINMVNVNDEE